MTAPIDDEKVQQVIISSDGYDKDLAEIAQKTNREASEVLKQLPDIYGAEKDLRSEYDFRTLRVVARGLKRLKKLISGR